MVSHMLFSVGGFVNLDASITISSGVAVDDTVFTVSATDSDAHIVMDPASQYFELSYRNGKSLTHCEISIIHCSIMNFFLDDNDFFLKLLSCSFTHDSP